MIQDKSLGATDNKAKHRNQSKRFIWQKRHWVLLIFVISYFLVSVLFNRGWIGEFRATFEPLNCILTFPILIASLWLVISAIRYPITNRNWQSVIPILAIIGTTLIFAFLPTKPTKAEMIFREQRSKLELINQQAENAQGARRTLKINIDPFFPRQNKSIIIYV